MLTEKKYRKDYQGEKIVTNRTYTKGVWEDVTEFIPNVVSNDQISNRACVIGNGLYREGFKMSAFLKPQGLLGADTLQTYGCNALYRDFAPDFLVATGKQIVKELAESEYCDNNIVYSSANNLVKYPKKFYLIPHNSYIDAGTTAMYLAAFDGHKTIYLLGHDYNNEGMSSNIYADTSGYASRDHVQDWSKIIRAKRHMFDLYDDVDWVWVTPYGMNQIHPEWQPCTNLRQLSTKAFMNETNLN